MDPFSGEGIALARRGWWTLSTLLGRSTNLTPNAAGSLNSQTAALPTSLGEIVEIGGGTDGLGPPMLETIQLCRSQDAYPLDPASNWDLRARLSVGAGATTHEIICDWMHGTTIALPGCGQISISAQGYAPRPGAPYLAPPEAATSLGVSVGSWAQGGTKPRFTQRLPVLAAPDNVSDVIAPPRWASRLQVYLQDNEQGLESTDPYTADVALYWIGPSGTDVFASVFAPSFPGTWYPIPAGARVRVVNGSGVALEATLVWELSL